MSFIWYEPNERQVKPVPPHLSKQLGYLSFATTFDQDQTSSTFSLYKSYAYKEQVHSKTARISEVLCIWCLLEPNECLSLIRDA